MLSILMLAILLVSSVNTVEWLDRVACFTLTPNDFSEAYEWDECDPEYVPDDVCFFLRMQPDGENSMALESITSLNCGNTTFLINIVRVKFATSNLITLQDVAEDEFIGLVLLFFSNGSVFDMDTYTEFQPENGIWNMHFGPSFTIETHARIEENIVTADLKGPLLLKGKSNSTSPDDKSVTIDLKEEAVQIRIQYQGFYEETAGKNLTAFSLDQVTDRLVQLFGEPSADTEADSRWVTRIIVILLTIVFLLFTFFCFKWVTVVLKKRKQEELGRTMSRYEADEGEDESTHLTNNQ